MWTPFGGGRRRDRNSRPRVPGFSESPEGRGVWTRRDVETQDGTTDDTRRQLRDLDVLCLAPHHEQVVSAGVGLRLAHE